MSDDYDLDDEALNRMRIEMFGPPASTSPSPSVDVSPKTLWLREKCRTFTPDRIAFHAGPGCTACAGRVMPNHTCYACGLRG